MIDSSIDKANMYKSITLIHDDIVVDIGIIIKPIFLKKDMLIIILTKTETNEK